MSKLDELVTFTAPSFAIFDSERNGVCTTPHGNLAIFSVRKVAEAVINSSSRSYALRIIPVWIKPAEEH